MLVSLCNFSINNLSLRPKTNVQTNSYPNLKPIECDTVSFSGRKTLIAEDMSIAPAVKSCTAVEKHAAPAKYYLERILAEYVGEYVDTTDSLPSEDYPILTCESRIKSPRSIREKVVSKFSASHAKMASNFTNKVFEELSRYYDVNEEADVEATIAEVQNNINCHDKRGAFMPHINPLLYYTIIQQCFEEAKIFNYSSVDETRQIEIDTEIANNLSEFVKSQKSLPLTHTNEGIKEIVSDIVGARIILREANPKYTKKVFDGIKRAVEDGKLEITSIENNIPDPDKLDENDNISNYIYATDSTLNSLKTVSGAPLYTNKSKTGYTAVHINVDFSDCDFAKQNSKFAGYRGEIQIIGEEVAQLKEIEDLCYKLKDNKKAIKAEYKPFKKHFQKYYVGDVVQHFDDYTYKAYLEQRAFNKKQDKKDFPSIKQLGFTGKVPEELDFNNLARIKRECDAVKKLNYTADLLKQIQAQIIKENS